MDMICLFSFLMLFFLLSFIVIFFSLRLLVLSLRLVHIFNFSR